MDKCYPKFWPYLSGHVIVRRDYVWLTIWLFKRRFHYCSKKLPAEGFAS